MGKYKKIELIKLTDADYNYRIDANNLNEHEISNVLDNLLYFSDEVEDYDNNGISCWLDSFSNALDEAENIKRILKIKEV